MNDLETDIRRALRRMLDPIDPAPTLGPESVRRSKIRHALSTVLAGSLAVLVVAAGAWGAIAIGRDTSESSTGLGGDPRSTEEPASPRLYLAGDGEIWMVDLSGRVRHAELSELSPGDAPHRIARRGQRLVAWGYETYLLDPELESPPQVLVQDSLIFIPSANDDRVWVGIPDPSNSTAELEAVREVSVSGETTVMDVRPPDGSWPERSVTDGLVFASRDGFIVWDPLSEQVVFRFDAGTLGPSHGNLIAWCDGLCESVHITDVATGSDKTVEPPPGFAAFDRWAGAFSPDGASLALPVRQEVRDVEGAAAELQLALVDVTSGTARTVEGSAVREGYNFVEWTPSGEYVFFTGGQEPEGPSIIFYRLDEEKARLLSVDVGDFFGAAAL